MIVLVVAGALLVALLVMAIRRIAACPLLRTLAASANCWADCVQAHKERAQH